VSEPAQLPVAASPADPPVSPTQGSDDIIVVTEYDGDEPPVEDVWDPETGATPLPKLGGRKPGSPVRTRRMVQPEVLAEERAPVSAQQRLLILDTWKRSGLPAGDFAPLVGVSRHTLYWWKQRFEAEGPAGLGDKKRGSAAGSRLPEVTRRAIIMMKESNPTWGVDQIAAMLARTEGLGASPGAVQRVLQEWGCEVVDVPTKPHPDHVRRWERETPNELWQTDLFTFILKRQNQRVYLVAFMDDHSRYIVSYGLHASQSGVFVLEALRAGIASYGTPREVLTDNGTQYVTWRGKSAFTHECEKRGIKQIVSRPRHPQTLGKVERFWGTLWREFLSTIVFHDLNDARTRIGHFIDHYNFRRVHSGLKQAVPADRFFAAAPQMRETLRKQVAANALEIARGGLPKAPFYLAGNVNGQAVSVHAEGDRLLMRTGSGAPVEVALTQGPALPPAQDTPAPQTPAAPPVSAWNGAEIPAGPGASAIDAVITAAHGATPHGGGPS
jgi:transposase InsO family protein